MSSQPWTDDENDLIVADYFAMLAYELAGKDYNKAEHNRILRSRLQNHRSRPSVEFKHRNISAVLMGLGHPWIPGYKPSSNFQYSLVNAVDRWLTGNVNWLARDISNVPSGWIGEPEPVVELPSLLEISNPPDPGQSLSKGEKRLIQVARHLDYAAQDLQNRQLGEAGEERVFKHECMQLELAGEKKLANQVRWVSKKDGDGAGYDIRSFTPDGKEKLIEVKTTAGWKRMPFYITRNELKVAEANPDKWRLVRLWAFRLRDFRQAPNAFELRPPLGDHVSLSPITYQASFNQSG